LKVALIVGFYEPVRKALERRFSEQMRLSALIWVRQVALNREADLPMFASQLARQLANGAKQVLVMVALPREQGWVEGSVRNIILEATSIHPDVDIQLSFEEKAADVDTVLQKVGDFDLPEPSVISAELLRSKLSTKTVLCVVMDGHTGFSESFVRAGFPPECICQEFFVDMVVPRGKNSNLMKVLYNKATQHQHILYAWTGLRTMPAKVKKRYSQMAFEGPTAKDVVNLFTRWLLGH
jgi:hypothetical protein